MSIRKMHFLQEANFTLSNDNIIVLLVMIISIKYVPWLHGLHSNHFSVLVRLHPIACNSRSRIYISQGEERARGLLLVHMSGGGQGIII